MKKVSLTIDEFWFEKLYQHLYPGDFDEHAAIVVVGIANTGSHMRLLVREIIFAEEGRDYVLSKHGYKELTAQFIGKCCNYCATQNLGYLAVHCHLNEGRAAFSSIDFDSHEKGYPALLDITKGGPVGAIVFAHYAVAGDIWTREGRFPLDFLKIVGRKIFNIYPENKSKQELIDPIYDRNTRLFGDIGQSILKNLKVGIIGLGGGGSLLNHWLSRLGVGHIIAIDDDKIDYTNLPRVVGATRWDAKICLTKSSINWIKALGSSLCSYKVDIAQRVAKRGNKSIKFEAIVGNILETNTAKQLIDCDFIFLCTDNIQSRLVFNALIYQYLIPGTLIGINIPKEITTKRIGEITVSSRPVFPYANGGCLECHNLIPGSKLTDESLSPEDKKFQRYVDDEYVIEPSVITLNVLSAAQAANDLMMLFTGLFEENAQLNHQIILAKQRKLFTVNNCIKENCPDCSDKQYSRRGKGDRVRLPCKE